MNIERKTTEKITWDIDLCEAEAFVTCENGKILNQVIGMTKLEASSDRHCVFWADDPQFIRDVHEALGKYIQHLDGIMRGGKQDDKGVEL